jgi:hypothetical protein
MFFGGRFSCPSPNFTPNSYITNTTEHYNAIIAIFLVKLLFQKNTLYNRRNKCVDFQSNILPEGIYLL